MDKSNLPDTKFKTLVIRMLNQFRRRVDKLGKNFNKVINNCKPSKCTNLSAGA